LARITKAVLSAALVFHLVAILVLPNPESVIYRSLEKVLVPYGNFLGLHTTWRFFSPNPQMRFLEYEALGFNDQGDISYSYRARFPEKGKDVISRESFNRMMNFAMIVSGRPDLQRSILKPVLCARNSKAETIYLYNLGHQIENIERARLSGGPREAISTLDRIEVGSFKCQGSD
jgi:hypothetical protein